ncbi:acetylserotonin O-methyltransferase [Streptomyces griseoviridis]|uniref:acetylserotonin O-methyltransferase n=1 Tax=Streptomyces griseoviridis TaxID=45398 RepID=UPI001F0C906B|nr:acetylserotonin O-methyltransferase [Streptomyces griseoviridis]
MHRPEESDPDYQQFYFLMNAPALYNAAATAAELHLFQFLSEHPGSEFEEIHKFTELPSHQLRVLLHGVCAVGRLKRVDGGYHNSRVAADLLASDSPDSWAHTLIGWKEIYYPAFVHLTEALKADTNTALAAHPGDEPTLHKRLTRNPELEGLFHRAMASFTLASIDDLVDREEFSGVTRLLDIGGGDGTTTVRLLERYPQLSSTIFDQPSLCRIAGTTDAGNFPDRIELHVGEFFDDPFPAGADAVLFSHVLGIFSEEQILTLLKKAYDVLPEGAGYASTTTTSRTTRRRAYSEPGSACTSTPSPAAREWHIPPGTTRHGCAKPVSPTSRPFRNSPSSTGSTSEPNSAQRTSMSR